MKAILSAGAALLAVSASSAFAADMPLKAPVKAPPPVFTWTGFYLGGNIGGSFGQAGTSVLLPGLVATGTSSQRMNGVVGGVQEGYNWQFGSWLAGIEADFDATSQRADTSLTGVTSSTVKLPWVGTIRGRFGITPSDHSLLYVTGGAAYGDIAFSATATAGTTIGTVSSNTWHTGWTIGGGFEYALDNNWSLRGEYLYIDLGSVTNTAITAGSPAVAPTIVATTSTSVTDNIVRFGVNYRFGGPAPVAAKY
jgi:outer membrane immunogenic protein